MSRNKLLMLIFPAFGAALIAILSQIVIPIGTVPFTLQTLAVGLIASIFRPREATLSVALYLLLGAIGLPVFAGGSGGIAALSGPTSGFLWGFLFYAALTSYLTNTESSLVKIFVSNLLGNCLAFICGVTGLHFLANMSWQAAFLAGVVPFIIPEIGKLLAITAISKSLFISLKNTAYFA